MINIELLNMCADIVGKHPVGLSYISPSKLKNTLKESPQSVFILDVRKRDIYRESHIEGAVNICVGELFQEAVIQKIPMDKLIVICCGIGHVASQK